MKSVSTQPVFDKQQIAAQFGHAAATYQAQAQLQNQAGDRLLQLLDISPFEIPDGPILEIGCGTGFITQRLVQRFPWRSLHITDLSSDMLRFCQSQIRCSPAQQRLLSFQQLDAEDLDPLCPNTPTASYALIVGGFVIQWFQHPIQSLRALLARLKPGGVLLLSFPTCQSFAEWQQMCQQLDLPYTANQLPAPDIMKYAMSDDDQAYFIDESFLTSYANVRDFFRSLTAIGAGHSQTGKQLSLSQMRRLVKNWEQQRPEKIEVHYYVRFTAIQRGDSK
jgi:malonyl-CoA O-methyltransferase